MSVTRDKVDTTSKPNNALVFLARALDVDASDIDTSDVRTGVFRRRTTRVTFVPVG